MFPNGSSTGLAYAKPMGVGTGILMGLDFLNNIMSLNKQPEMNMPDIIYGSLTNNKDNIIRNENVNGSISFGSNTVQNGNVYGGQPPYDNSNYSDNSGNSDNSNGYQNYY